jgi:hypothetical protein
VIVCLGPRSHQGTGSSPQGGIRRTRRVVGDRSIVRECRRRSRKFGVSRPDGEGIYVGCCTHLDWSLQFKQYWLRNENFSRFRAKIANFCFQQLYLFAWSASSHLQQAIDDGVQIYLVLVGHGCGPLVGQGGMETSGSCGAFAK